MAILKQSTAYTRAFFMVQTADHVTALTGATPAVTLSKAGAAFASAGGIVTEIANGWYKIALTTTDTNTLGDLAVHATAASGDPVDMCDQIVSALAADVPTNLLDLSAGIETGLTPRQAFRLMSSALFGKVSGLPGSPVFRDYPDTKARITATTDTSGNRSVVTTDAT